MNVSLDAIRADGWFERTGETVGSFQALCEILGERFFAFSLITGARVTALSVDRREPNKTLVEFQVGGDEAAEAPRMTLDRFRRRLVNALVTEEPSGAQPANETDVEGIQRFIGVRYLLLAPLYGYGLIRLRVDKQHAALLISENGQELEVELAQFQARLRSLVVEELDRVTEPDPEDSGLNLARIPEAEKAFEEGDYWQVVGLLGSWAAPLTLLLRTADGQALDVDTKAMLAQALGFLGLAIAKVGNASQAHDVLRLGVQYAVDTPKAGVAYSRLGQILFRDGRYGEAIGALRRGANLGADPREVWPLLSLAFLERGRLLAALGAVEQGQALGLQDPRLVSVRERVEERLEGFEPWRALVRKGSQRGDAAGSSARPS